MPSRATTVAQHGSSRAHQDSHGTATRHQTRHAFEDNEVEEARRSIALAFQVLGLVANSQPVCPECGATKGKVKLFPDSGGWHCYKRGHHGNSAIDLLMEHGNYNFTDAVSLLLGRPVRKAGKVVDLSSLPDLPTAPAFRAVVDTEVYNTVVRGPWSSLEAAQNYYATWHVHSGAVREAGARVVIDQVGMESNLVSMFGMDRLVACGLVVPPEQDRGPFWLLNKNYPVIEPHVLPYKGDVVGMQFRPSKAQKAKILAHKAWKRRFSGVAGPDGSELEPGAAWEQASAKDPAGAGPRAPYVPAFMSLRGAGPDSLVGCGLYRVAQLTKPATIYVVEGFKDLLAARTLGAEAYAVPGVGATPPALALELFRNGGHRLLVCMDGDSAGAEGRERLSEVFKTAQLHYSQKTDMPDGMDVADILVSRHAASGCKCHTCTSWRAEHS